MAPTRHRRFTGLATTCAVDAVFCVRCCQTLCRVRCTPYGRVKLRATGTRTLKPAVSGLQGQETALDVVQFDSAIYYCEEKEGEIVIDVVRFGSLDSSCSVTFSTQDLGQGNRDPLFEAVTTRLDFKHGELSKEVRVPIVRSPEWRPICEFKLRLSDPVNCELTRYLCSARVKVIDNDHFPTNQAMNLSGQKNLKGDATDLRLVFEFSKFIYGFRGMPRKTWITLFVDQLSNVYLLLTTYLLKYVTDDILASDGKMSLLIPDSPDSTLALVSALYGVPYIFLYFAQRYTVELRLAEDAKARIQDFVFARTLNLASGVQRDISDAEVTLLISKDAEEVVTGYTKTLGLAKEAGKLLVSAGFIIANNYDAIYLLLFFGAAILLFLRIRYNATVSLTEAYSKTEAAVVDSVQKSCVNYRTIRDYYVRPDVREYTLDKIKKQADATLPLNLRKLNADRFPVALSTILLALYIPLGGKAVFDDTIEIGAFLATLNILQAAGESYSAILSSLLDMTSAIAPMSAITELMNMEIFPLERKPLNRQGRQTTKEERIWTEATNLFGSDLIPVKLQNVSFRYPGSEKDVFSDVTMSVPQGKMIALVGPPHGGKSTILKLLGQVLQPTAGEVFVPSYLRLLHVSRHFSNLLDGGLWKNLTLGCQATWIDRKSEVERVIRICKRIGFQKPLLDILEEGKQTFLEDSGRESEPSLVQLSLTDRVLINVARGLIYDPNIMVLNRPTVELSPALAKRVGKILREFVDERGFEIPDNSPSKRRPRTVFASYLRKEDTELVDVFWRVEAGKMYEVSPAEIYDRAPSARKELEQ